MLTGRFVSELIFLIQYRTCSTVPGLVHGPLLAPAKKLATLVRSDRYEDEQYFLDMFLP